MTSAAELATEEKLSTALSKKSGMKREVSPCTPYKRKARGKENNPGALSTGLFACAGAYAHEVERYRLLWAIFRNGSDREQTMAELRLSKSSYWWGVNFFLNFYSNQ